MFFLLSFFSFVKSENKRVEEVLPKGEGWHWCDREGGRKRW
jgi:hypothetical protein